ncbi:hypothetical protein HPB52_022493 [Rhipicephalus sanguineus]|uniref:Uncharacterized protein n=1 Tax=Rhipicephalus sanguineus TaxID=34632 RepID=A0A9D4T4U4_RHISA|nr:hypothetical protein HPB52_022493 [Rhipicephalus sanguineus]
MMLQLADRLPPRIERSVERPVCDDRSCKHCHDSLRAKAIEELLVAKLKERRARLREDGSGGDDAVLEELQDESQRWMLKAFANCRSGVKTPRKAFRNILEHQGLGGFPFHRDPSRTAEMRRVARASGVSPLARVSLDQDIREGRHVHSHEKWYSAAVAKAASGVPLPTLFNVEKKLVELAASSTAYPGFSRRSRAAYEDKLQTHNLQVPRAIWLTNEEQSAAVRPYCGGPRALSGINTCEPVIQAVERNRLKAIDELRVRCLVGRVDPPRLILWATEDTLEFPMGLFSRAYEGDAFWLYHLPRAGVKVSLRYWQAIIETAKVSDRAFRRLLHAKECSMTHVRMPERQTP